MRKTKKLQEGDKAPDFCLANAESSQACLQHFKGKWVVLYFYPKDDTPGCTMEGIAFTNQLGQFKKLGGVVIGISPDSCASHAKFTEKHGLKVALLSDPERKVLKQYGVWQKKVLSGKESMGVVRSTFLIDPQGTVRRMWTNVKVEGHADKVRATLSELRG